MGASCYVSPEGLQEISDLIIDDILDEGLGAWRPDLAEVMQKCVETFRALWWIMWDISRLQEQYEKSPTYEEQQARYLEEEDKGGPITWPTDTLGYYTRELEKLGTKDQDTRV